jgi:hypothetical protein
MSLETTQPCTFKFLQWAIATDVLKLRMSIDLKKKCATFVNEILLQNVKQGHAVRMESIDLFKFRFSDDN